MISYLDSFLYSETSLKTDLASQEKPIWDLSVYGPAKEEPNLIVGTDRSFEEDRLKYYLSRIQTGNENQFVSNSLLLVYDATRYSINYPNSSKNASRPCKS